MGMGARCAGGTGAFPSPIARRVCPCVLPEDFISQIEPPKAQPSEIARTESSCELRQAIQVDEEEKHNNTNIDVHTSPQTFWSSSLARLLGVAVARTATSYS